MSNTVHTAGPMIVLFSGQTASLYFDKEGEARAKDRILQLPRNSAIGDADPNVRFLRTLAAAPKLLEALRQIYSLEVRASGMSPLQYQREVDSIAAAAIARATGETP